MTHSYTSGSGLGKQLQRLGLAALLVGGTALASQAQSFTYDPSLSYNLAGTYTDLGTNGTVITTANTDDANSAAQNIGFSFNFNGIAFTQFVLNTNGLMRLGASAPSSALAASPYAQAPDLGPVNSTDAADVNLIMPFNFDLTAGSSTPEYRVYTTGTAGSRVCTIQWKNVADKAVAGSASSATAVPTHYANFSFQVKLYEGSNQIDFVYGTATAGPATSTDAAKFANVGLKGSDNVAYDNITTVKASVNAWSTTTFSTGPQAAASNAHNFRSTVLPDAGRTYRFLAPVANDAAVTNIYTLGKLSTAALPHTIQAVISNNGTTTLTNQSVTLTVSGANTFTNTQTITSLQSGYYTIVSFAALPATLAAGVNNVAVTVPADGNNNNNSFTVQQTVNTTGTLSYVPTNLTNTQGNSVYGYPVAGGIFGTKYTTQKAGTVTSVSIFLTQAATSSTVASSVGQTVYGVVTSPSGVVLGQSANYVIQAGDIGTYKTFTITTPPAVAAGGSFIAGLAQPAYTGGRYYPVAVQDELPTRSDAYFSVPIGGGTPVDYAATSNFARFLMEATVSVTLSTSKELQRAVTIYPNPSESGIFNLDVQNANAMGNLGVEVTNQLGQRVFAGSARDNFTTKLDLSNLAAGIYHLQVRNGQEYMSSQISIVK